MTKRGTQTTQPSKLRMARSRGAVTGPLLMLLGIWGAIVPFIGHSFGFGYTPDNTWTWTVARGWLEVLPGAATFVGGTLLTVSSHRVSAMIGAWLAAAAGAWFVLGTMVGPLWSAGNIGVASGSGHHVVYEQVGMFAGLGVVIVFLAAVALGRVSVVGVRDMSVAQIDLTSAPDDATFVKARPVTTVDLFDRDDAEPAPEPDATDATDAADSREAENSPTR
jgi:hypothetical protein